MPTVDSSRIELPKWSKPMYPGGHTALFQQMRGRSGTSYPDSEEVPITFLLDLARKSDYYCKLDIAQIATNRVFQPSRIHMNRKGYQR